MNQHVCIIRTVDPGVREFIALFMKSSPLKAQIDATQTGAARDGLNFAQIAQFAIPLPQKPEQNQIVRHLLDICFRIDVLVAEAQRAVDLLLERRGALISAAVTGQIDVRDVVAQSAAA